MYYGIEFVAPTPEQAERMCALFEKYCRIIEDIPGVVRMNSGLTSSRRGFKIEAAVPFHPLNGYDCIRGQLIREFHRGNGFRPTTKKNKFRILLLPDEGD